MWLCVCAARAGDLGWRAPAGVPGSNMGGHIVLTGEGTACTYCRQRQGHRGMGRGAEHTGAGGDRHCMRLGGRLPSNLQRVQGVSANSQFSPPPSTAACFTTHPLHSGFLHLGRVWRRFLHRTHTCFPPPPPACACMHHPAGRAKDTLVLLSGKNIEPQPIEDALCRSPFIK